MKTVTAAEMRELDRRTIEEYGVPGEVLMERAGRGVADTAIALAERSGRLGRMWIVAGKGNNGGDAFVAARHLKQAGFDIQVCMTTTREEITGDAQAHLARMLDEGISPLAVTNVAPPSTGSAAYDLVIDGVLGTGISGPSRGMAAAGIELVNELGRERPVIAIDIPSGLDADTGAASGTTVVADLTLTMGLPKRGLAMPRALDFVGSVEVIDIGIPAAFTTTIESYIDVVVDTDLRPRFGRRRRSVHKGDCGHVLLIGGSRGFAGAIAMAATAALRSGAGLVSVLTPTSVASAVATMIPEAMVHAGPETADGVLQPDALAAWQGDLNTISAMLVGPGLGRTHDTTQLVSRVLDTHGPLVLDADALPDADQGETLRGRNAPLVITPHPGEMARLLGRTSSDIQADRFDAARAAVAATGATTVLKGAGTVIADASPRLSVNLTGNPGMATGGTGDVLAGLLTGLLGQRLPPHEAACAAVYLHGLAGDFAAWNMTQPAITARDLIAALPDAWRRLAHT